MKKTSKFLALVLSFLTTASSIGLARAVKPEFKVNTQEMISFKNHISQSEFSKDYKVDDTCITKKEMEEIDIREYTGHYASIMDKLKGYDIIITVNCVSLHNIMTLMYADMYAKSEGKIDRDICTRFLCSAMMNRIKLPEELKFNSVSVHCKMGTETISFKQDGIPVFEFKVYIF